jgi:hypothetical protein
MTGAKRDVVSSPVRRPIDGADSDDRSPGRTTARDDEGARSNGAKEIVDDGLECLPEISGPPGGFSDRGNDERRQLWL